MSIKSKKDWYKVDFEDCFYDDMIGFVAEIRDRVITLDFGGTVGKAIFYKNQLRFDGQY